MGRRKGRPRSAQTRRPESFHALEANAEGSDADFLRACVTTPVSCMSLARVRAFLVLVRVSLVARRSQTCSPRSAPPSRRRRRPQTSSLGRATWRQAAPSPTHLLPVSPASAPRLLPFPSLCFRSSSRSTSSLCFRPPLSLVFFSLASSFSFPRKFPPPALCSMPPGGLLSSPRMPRGPPPPPPAATHPVPFPPPGRRPRFAPPFPRAASAVVQTKGEHARRAHALTPACGDASARRGGTGDVARHPTTHRSPWGRAPLGRGCGARRQERRFRALCCPHLRNSA